MGIHTTICASSSLCTVKDLGKTVKKYKKKETFILFQFQNKDDKALALLMLIVFE